MKAFISYSHADQVLATALMGHLSGLKRTGWLTSWIDRDISPGTQIDQKILAELRESQIVLLLVSAQFISSSYCMDVEVAQALEQHKVGRSRVIPIIVRPEASWTRMPFGSLLALPTDGRAVTSWPNEDDAWVSVVNGIRVAIDEMRMASLPPDGGLVLPQQNSEVSVASTYAEDLEEVGTPYVHPRAKKLSLSALFIYPDLELIDRNGGRALMRSAERALKTCEFAVVVGDRQSGKTSLLKKIVIDAIRNGQSALYVDAKGQKLDNFSEWVIRLGQTKLGRQLPEKLDVIVLDNYDLGQRGQFGAEELLKLRSVSHRVIASTSTDAIYSPGFAKRDAFREAEAFKITRFDAPKRRKLIEKWLRLDNDEGDQDIRRALDRLETEVNSVLRRNVVPAIPVHVLLVLQSLESVAANKTELTSYGHCYSHMITTALAKTGVKPSDIDVYWNLLTELSYAMHVLGARSMSRTELDAFLDAYKAQYLAPSKSTLVDTLLDSGLMRSEGEYFTVYRYVGGYFAGRYIAEALAGKAFDAAQKRLTFLADNAHNDDCALVLLFVCHHTKNPAVLETILLNTMVALDGSPTSLFEREEFEAIGEMLGQIPRATIYAEPLDDSIERKLELQDARDAVASELDDASPSLGPNEEIAKFLRAMKAIEITGQLVRNRHGSLDVLQISELVEQAISCAQRIAGFVIDLSTQLKDMLPGMVSEMQQRHPGRTKDRLEAELRRFVNFCCHFSLHGLMSNVSQQLCNDALKGLVLDKLSARDDYFARLLYVHVRLKLEDHSVIHDIQRTIVQFEKNAFVLNLLQHAVADRVQLFDIPFDDKQRIAEMFKIDVPTQVAMHKPIYGRR